MNCTRVTKLRVGQERQEVSVAKSRTALSCGRREARSVAARGMSRESRDAQSCYVAALATWASSVLMGAPTRAASSCVPRPEAWSSVWLVATACSQGLQEISADPRARTQPMRGVRERRTAAARRPDRPRPDAPPSRLATAPARAAPDRSERPELVARLEVDGARRVEGRLAAGREVEGRAGGCGRGRGVSAARGERGTRGGGDVPSVSESEARRSKESETVLKESQELVSASLGRSTARPAREDRDAPAPPSTSRTHTSFSPSLLSNACRSNTSAPRLSWRSAPGKDEGEDG